MWTTPKPVKLDNEELEDIWSWFTDWHDLDDGETPDLTDEDYESICNAIERLLGYVAYLKNVHEIVKELTSEVKSVKSDLIELKRKRTTTVKVDKNSPNHKRSRI
jgi:hypothetical protein